MLVRRDAVFATTLLTALNPLCATQMPAQIGRANGYTRRLFRRPASAGRPARSKPSETTCVSGAPRSLAAGSVGGWLLSRPIAG